jgi:ribosomal protein L24
MAKMQIRKGDRVKVMRGNERGKEGTSSASTARRTAWWSRA